MTKEQQLKKDQRIEAFTRWVIKWRYLVILGSVALAFVAAMGAKHLYFNNNYRAFFGKTNPQLEAFEALQSIYTKDDNVMIVMAPKNGEAFAPEFLDVVEKITADGWQVPYSLRVDSLTNYQHTEANGDDLVVRNLVEDAKSTPAAELERARSIALSEPLLVDRLVSRDGDVVGVNITIEFPEKSATEVPEVVAHVRNLVDDYRGDHPEIDFYISGLVLLNNAFQEMSQKDMSTLVPGMYLVILLFLMFFLRSVPSTIATAGVIMLSTITAMGIAGWFRTGLTPPSAIAPTIILTLAVADSVHILVSMLQAMRRKGMQKYDAIVEAMKLNMQPVFITSLTTAIGFLSMNFSDSPPFHHMGNITAVGVIAAWIYSIFFLPAAMAILPMREKIEKRQEYTKMDNFAEFVIRRQRGLMWGTLAVVIFLASFTTKIELNDEFVKYFDPKVAFRTDTDFMSQNLTGIYRLDYSIGSGESGGIANPQYLAQLEAFSNWLREQPEVLNVNTYTDVMKRLNKNMHGDDPSYYGVPDSRELAAQYLLLYEMSLPFGLDLNNQINVEKSSTRLNATLKDMSTRQIRAVSKRADNWLKSNTDKVMHAESSSPAVMFSYISERNIIGMLGGTALAIILITLSISIAMRSFKFGLLSMIPNILPALTAFGVWGLLVGQVGMAIAPVASMTLGLVVDDSVHFLSKYLRARRKEGLNPSKLYATPLPMSVERYGQRRLFW